MIMAYIRKSVKMSASMIAKNEKYQRNSGISNEKA